MLTANDLGAVFSNPLGMRKKTMRPAIKPKPDDDDPELPPLFVGEWLARLGIKPTKIAADANVNEGYLSEVIAGGKRNPGRLWLAKVAKAAGIPPHYFNVPPPPVSAINALSQFDTATLDRLKPK